MRIAALPPDLPALAGVARGEGFRMLDRLAAEWAAGEQRFDGPGEALFAARDRSGVLLGIGGITRDPWAEALRMRRFHVRPEARRLGIGRALAAAAITLARDSGAGRIRLRAPAAAAGFWERLGFLPCAAPDGKATHTLFIA